jgi:hypothetical protein
LGQTSHAAKGDFMTLTSRNGSAADTLAKLEAFYNTARNAIDFVVSVNIQPTLQQVLEAISKRSRETDALRAYLESREKLFEPFERTIKRLEGKQM